MMDPEGSPGGEVDPQAIAASLLSEDDVEVISEFFKALADPTRVNIVNALQEREWLCVTDLAAVLGLTVSAISHQLCYLRMNKLVKVRREGKRMLYALCDDHVRQVFAMAVSHVKEP